MRLKIALVLLLIVGLFSSFVFAVTPMSVNVVSDFEISSLPCRTLNYEIEVTNNDVLEHQYEISVDKYSDYVNLPAEFILHSGERKGFFVTARLPCSINGHQEFNVKIKPVDASYGANVKLVANIEADYAREISVLPVSVCANEIGTGALHVKNPTSTPNIITVIGNYPKWFNILGNKVTLVGNSQADFNFTINGAEPGHSIVGLVVNDFSGSEEIPLDIDVINCNNELTLLDTSVTLISGEIENFSLPVKGSGQFELAVQGPEWLKLSSESLIIDGQNKVYFEAFPIGENVIGSYDVVLMARNELVENSSIINMDLTVKVSDSKVLMFISKNGSMLLGLFLLLIAITLLVINYKGEFSEWSSKIVVEKVNSKNEAVKIATPVKILKKKVKYEDLDFSDIEQGKIKLVRPINAYPASSMSLWKKALLWIIGILLVLSLLIWKFFALIKAFFVGLFSEGRIAWLVEKWALIGPYSERLAVLWDRYGYYVILTFVVIVVIVVVDQLRVRGYFKKLYDYLFKEPEE